MGEIQVNVIKSGKVIDQVLRPQHAVGSTVAVRYRRRLWPVRDGHIDLDGPSLEPGQAESKKSGHADGVDPSQEAVLAEPSDARIVVDAGPGTGKTHVACMRVARLVAEAGVQPSRVWIISFTRTAVIEIRARIAAALGDARAASVRVATLDSYAWSIQSGFDETATLTGSYEDNIEAVLVKVRSDENVKEYLERVEHLIIDEAQDIVGVRADLTEALIEALPPECGVSVFADEAQAIYGFAEDRPASGAVGPSLLERLRSRGFSQMSLERIRRTDNPALRRIFTEVRQEVLRRSKDPVWRLQQVGRKIEQLSHGPAGELRSFSLADLADGTLVLFRRRLDVLMTSSLSAEIPHRLRMSGMPPAVHPWLVRCFWDFDERRLSRAAFDRLWCTRTISGEPGPADGEAAWKLLIELAGETPVTVDMHLLRRRLARTAPPLLMCSPEYGAKGPILSTIHASKGREAEGVVLFLPDLESEELEPDEANEEARVLFVGATRARHRLLVGTSSLRGGAPLESGRAFRFSRSGKVQIEIGRPEDLLAEGLVGRTVTGSVDRALASQQSLLATPVQTGLLAVATRDFGWRYRLLNAEDECLGVLSDRLRQDMTEAARRAGGWTVTSAAYLRSIGIRSMVLAPEDPRLENLHSPWSESGFVAAPMLTSLSPLKVKK